MTCFRCDVMHEEFTHCQEMSAIVFDSDQQTNIQCFCFGVVDPGDRLSPEHSKRFCIIQNDDVDDEDDAVDLQLDLSDTDVMAIMSIFSHGTLNILQRARIASGWATD